MVLGDLEAINIIEKIVLLYTCLCSLFVVLLLVGRL
jgi:hypothetical protein